MKRIIASVFILVLAVSALLGLTACSDKTSESAAKSSGNSKSTAALEKTNFTLGYLNSTAHLLAFVAQEEGYFKQEGLHVTLTQLSNGTELTAGLESGKLDVALIGSFSGITLQSNGHDISFFGGAMTNGHGIVIKPKYTAGLSSWDVNILKGHSVAVAKNSTDDLELKTILKSNNIQIGKGKDQVNVAYFDSQKDAFAALANSEIDACSVYSPYASLAKGQGYKVVYYDANIDLFKNLPCCRQTALTSKLSTNANSYVAFERAMIKAYKFYQQNQDKTIQDVSKYIDIDKNYIRTEVYGGYCTSNPDPDKKATVKLKDNAIAAKFVKDYDINKLYNTKIYEKALGSIITENPNDKVYKSLQDHFNQYE